MLGDTVSECGRDSVVQYQDTSAVPWIPCSLLICTLSFYIATSFTISLTLIVIPNYKSGSIFFFIFLYFCLPLECFFPPPLLLILTVGKVKKIKSKLIERIFSSALDYLSGKLTVASGGLFSLCDCPHSLVQQEGRKAL